MMTVNVYRIFRLRAPPAPLDGLPVRTALRRTGGGDDRAETGTNCVERDG